MAELTPAQLLIAKVPAGTADNPGIYDSKKDPKVKITGLYSSIFIESIDGADNIDIELYEGGVIHSNLENIKASATYGMSNPDKLHGTFNRIVMKNSTNAVVTVEIRINNYGMFYYSNSGGGGGGVATHVKIDGTAQVEVTKAPPVTINIPKDLEVIIKDGTKVGLSDGASVEVSKMPKVDVAFPTSMPVTGTVEVSKMPKVDVTFPSTMPVTGTVDVGKMPKVDVTFPSTMPVTGTVDVGKMPKVDVTFPSTMPVTGTVDVGKMPKVDITFPTSMKTEITNSPTVKIDGAVDIAGIVGISGFADDAAIGIKGDVIIDTSKKPLDVAFDGSAIKVVPAPPPGLCAGGNPGVSKTIAKLVSARAKRIKLSIQSNYNNSGNVYIRDTSTAHAICAIIPAGASWSDDYSGELWANADSDDCSVQLMELYND